MNVNALIGVPSRGLLCECATDGSSAALVWGLMVVAGGDLLRRRAEGRKSWQLSYGNHIFCTGDSAAKIFGC